MPGGRPTKPVALVKGHRTKAEKAVREKAESALLTGTPMKEDPKVKRNPVAHKEFTRVKRLLKSIDKDDDLSGNVINTHCKLHAECDKHEDTVTESQDDLAELNKAYRDRDIDILTYLEKKDKILDSILSFDKKVMEKRKMMLDIAKENVLTIQSALRSIQKKEGPAKEDPDAYLFGDG